MRIGSPPPVQSATIDIGAIAAPTVFQTLSTTQLTTLTSTQIAAISDQTEIQISNPNSTGGVWLQANGTPLSARGIFLGPNAIASLNVNTTVQISNLNTVTITLGVNQIGN